MQQDAQTKDIIFFSNFCEFSKDIINIITKHNMRDKFTFVCVDNINYKIPAFVDRVPCLYKRTGEMYTDEYLYDYINKETQRLSVSDNINPIWSIYGKDNAYSSHFSTLDGTEYEENPNYVSIKSQENMNISFKPESTVSSKDQKKINDTTFEKFIESRNLDDSIIKKRLQTNSVK